MKRALNIFFVTLGIVFFGLILIGVYLFAADPLNLKPMLINVDTTSPVEADTSSTQTDKHPLLSETQEKTLETFGIDPAAVPTTVTPAQEACFIETLGASRVEEIKAGDAPTASEFFRAKSCL